MGQIGSAHPNKDKKKTRLSGNMEGLVLEDHSGYSAQYLISSFKANWNAVNFVCCRCESMEIHKLAEILLDSPGCAKRNVLQE